MYSMVGVEKNYAAVTIYRMFDDADLNPVGYWFCPRRGDKYRDAKHGVSTVGGVISFLFCLLQHLYLIRYCRSTC